MAASPRSSSTRVRSPASLASSFQSIPGPAAMHAADDAYHASSSDESFASFSEDSSEDDEIVWSVSDLSASVLSSQAGLRSPELFSDDDFIVLGQRPPTITTRAASTRTPSVGSADLEEVFAALTVDTAASPPATPESKKAAKRKARKARRTAQAGAAPQKGEPGLGARPIVDDVSEAGDAKPVSLYEDAVQYVSSFLSAPSKETKKKSDLTLLQALIVELGLCSATSPSGSEESFYHLPSLPRTIRAAKALLKSSVFVNVRDYLEQRNKGLDELRKVMHPSRRALVKDLGRGKGARKVPRDFVKNTGLGVLLVTCYA
ncbi:hypothetical protein PHLGIDRAFT_116527 [Phlebiopsis gigantea 11061_1 CR5-6]|uniref:Uncharacterized protein n=1 Tax=Phlebiopsis gigantea (strain 11061_1 CR5-6) TaxID=745531 RepID=A0A0C3PQD0_PHLG1|nr:hypothetical protein PHLGIDRAFT_116527 [Phlebiopsis gigantea 11061_1 CR5-6]